ncbi:tRNA pseudouridine(55) synthase TruB, partial [Candidatus Nomurabacteria bacterium]|nr:tRNA pseudouridine(55) synthase TruB [Candidatus Nomurabacteria bacterium]
MKKVIVLNKKEGETPLQALDKFRVKNKEYKYIKMTYAGRLDPMASGLLLALAGEETKNKEKYLKLKKEYDFEVLFGFATDTYDI